MSYIKPLLPPKRPVHDEGSLQAFEYYAELISQQGIESKNEAETENGDPTALCHLRWMCEHCAVQVRDDGQGYNDAKYSRWLGYIQGCLIMHGITTVEDERNRTRPWFANQ